MRYSSLCHFPGLGRQDGCTVGALPYLAVGRGSRRKKQGYIRLPKAVILRGCVMLAYSLKIILEVAFYKTPQWRQYGTGHLPRICLHLSGHPAIRHRNLPARLPDGGAGDGAAGARAAADSSTQHCQQLGGAAHNPHRGRRDFLFHPEVLPVAGTA